MNDQLNKEKIMNEVFGSAETFEEFKKAIDQLKYEIRANPEGVELAIFIESLIDKVKDNFKIAIDKSYQAGIDSIHNMSRRACWEDGYQKGQQNVLSSDIIKKEIEDKCLIAFNKGKSEFAKVSSNYSVGFQDGYSNAEKELLFKLEAQKKNYLNIEKETRQEALKEFKKLIDEVIENGSWKNLLELKVKLSEAGR